MKTEPDANLIYERFLKVIDIMNEMSQWEGYLLTSMVLGTLLQHMDSEELEQEKLLNHFMYKVREFIKVVPIEKQDDA